MNVQTKIKAGAIQVNHTQRVKPKGIKVNTQVKAGGIFYALWHPDRFRNSVLYDPSPGVDGVRGSTLMQHLAYVANRKDVWYVANGWLYSYRYVAENACVEAGRLGDR